jgi:GrpB-like predicted nucleotidyltransferase (UPF0157 family)
VKVEVVAYDPRWPLRFVAVRDDLLAALDGVPVIAIEHVGSTSVPGLAAKPRLDIDVVVAADLVTAASDALHAAGYVALGDQGIPDRYAFSAPDHAPPRNVYVVVDGSLALRNHLAVRDVLRRDATLRDEYARHKLELATRDYADGDDYVVDKSPMLQRILERAGIGPDERRAIDAANRLDA